MSLTLPRRAAGATAAFLIAATAACSADHSLAPQTPEVTAPDANLISDLGVGCQLSTVKIRLGRGNKSDSLTVTRCAAKAGDLLDAQLKEFHATQPSLGYDEVYYKLGRYRSNKDELAGNFNKRFDDWCESNGQEKAAAVSAGARLTNPTSFTCTVAVGSETPETIAPMKSAVVGPGGELYLTDGHHTFTSFWETADAGPAMHIRVRILGNFSTMNIVQFWREMERRQWVWLYDANDRRISPYTLPSSLGLKEFGDDKYRGVLYFARDIGYEQLPENAIFQEFYWGRWLRGNNDPALDPSKFDLNDLTSYLALVKNISKAQTALDDNAIVSGGQTALQLGKLSAWNAGKAENKGEFAKLSVPYDQAKPGKIAYALDYKKSLPTPTPGHH